MKAGPLMTSVWKTPEIAFITAAMMALKMVRKQASTAADRSVSHALPVPMVSRTRMKKALIAAAFVHLALPALIM
jgi:hypothetical protein